MMTTQTAVAVPFVDRVRQRPPLRERLLDAVGRYFFNP